MTQSYMRAKEDKKHTDNEVDLRPKGELKKTMTHELRHFDRFDNTVLSNCLRVVNLVAKESEC